MLTKSDIKLIKSLSAKSARTENGIFVVEGEKMVKEALDSGFTVERVFVTEKFSSDRSDKRIELVSGKEMERISHLKTPSCALAIVRIPDNGFDAKVLDKGLVLALDDVQDPGNMGTIIRTADWFGIENIICSRSTADCYNPKVVQATMGALFRVNVHYDDLLYILKEAHERKVPVYGTFLDGENVYHSNLSKSGVIVMGNEGKGISVETASFVNRRLFIPPFPESHTGSESLNVSTATAIVCSEFRRH